MAHDSACSRQLHLRCRLHARTWWSTCSLPLPTLRSCSCSLLVSALFSHLHHWRHFRNQLWGFHCLPDTARFLRRPTSSHRSQYHQRHVLPARESLSYQCLGLLFPHRCVLFINVCTVTTLTYLGPYLGPFISAFAVETLAWSKVFGILCGFYGFSVLAICLMFDETLYDRANPHTRASGIGGRIQNLIGITAMRESAGRPSIFTVMKHQLSLIIKPYVFLPSKPISNQFASSVHTNTICSIRLQHVHDHVDHRHRLHNLPPHPPTPLPLQRDKLRSPLPRPHDRHPRRRSLGLLVQRLPTQELPQEKPQHRRLPARTSSPRCLRPLDHLHRRPDPLRPILPTPTQLGRRRFRLGHALFRHSRHHHRCLILHPRRVPAPRRARLSLDLVCKSAGRFLRRVFSDCVD